MKQVMGGFLLVPILLPILGGVLLGVLPFGKRALLEGYVIALLAVEAVFSIVLAFVGEGWSLSVFSIGEGLTLVFCLDALGAVWLVLVSVLWLLVGIFAFEYMLMEERERLFFAVYLLTGGLLSGLSLSGNLLTFYVFYEFTSIVSALLVLHSRKHDAVMAALKYLFYSMAGALMVLFGLFVFSRLSADGGVTFVAGGILDAAEVTPLLLIAVFFMILGFGTKAGMFPLHAWLPAAHPVAPTPASAVLSGLITKAGVLGVIRTVYYVAGAEAVRGTWVQTAWVVLSLVTVFMGSMLAFKERVFKKRLAYSTVSQVSYVMFGLAMLEPTAFVGALLHVAFHALAKNALFLSAGAILYKTGKSRVEELWGIGRQMPVVMGCFTLASLSLIGIPPLAGFVSKWYLAVGALSGGMGMFSWLGPVVLLVSALLTAGYLLPVSIRGFLIGSKTGQSGAAELKKAEPGLRMLLPLVLLAAASLLFGLWPTGLIRLFERIAAAVFTI